MKAAFAGTILSGLALFLKISLFVEKFITKKISHEPICSRCKESERSSKLIDMFTNRYTTSKFTYLNVFQNFSYNF